MTNRSLKHKLLIFLAVWRRPAITEICFRGIQRLKEHSGYDIDALAVISEESMIELCRRYGIRYVMAENWPLGKKKNEGLAALKEIEFDFLMEIGSDDLVFNELLDVYEPYFGKYDFFGMKDFLYLDSESGHCRRHRSNKTTYGAGRMISRKALESVGFKLWQDGLCRGLDNNSTALLASKGFKYYQIETPGPMCVDVKSEENIWKFNHLLGCEHDVNYVFERVSDDEKKMLCQLWS